MNTCLTLAGVLTLIPTVNLVLTTGAVIVFVKLSEVFGSADGVETDIRFTNPSGIYFDGINLYVNEIQKTNINSKI